MLLLLLLLLLFSSSFFFFFFFGVCFVATKAVFCRDKNDMAAPANNTNERAKARPFLLMGGPAMRDCEKQHLRNQSLCR